ncbi:MAG: hypothetical protein IKL05_06365 [Clostridia bacterium]|nr:hypothetical protein [Clostridia bacterium]
MSEYYTSGDILAKNKSKTNTKKDLAGDYLAEKGYERQVNPRRMNGGRDRLPQDYAAKNKVRLNSSLATTPAQAKPGAPKSANVQVAARKKRVRPLVKVTEVRKEKPKTPFPISAILCLIAITLISLYVIHLYIELDELNATLTNYNNQIAEMKNEERVLQSQKASKYNLEEIERIAKEKYGMVDADQLPKEYITSDNEDSIEIMETDTEEKTPGALLSGFAGVVSNLLSYIN